MIRTSLRPAILYTLLLTGLVAFYAVWAWSTVLGGFGGDNAVYLLSAQSIRSGGEAALAHHYAHSGPYPPLYPLLLAVFGGGRHLLAAHLATAAALVGACMVFLLWLRATGLGPMEASLYVLALALVPGIEQSALQILSEPLYLLTSLTALWAASKHEKNGQARWMIVAALGVAMALLTRSAGIALWLAFTAWILARRPRRELFFAVSALVPFALWQVWHLHRSSYVDDLMAHYHEHLFSRLWDQITTEAHALWIGWSANITGPIRALPFLAVSSALALLAMVGSLRRLLAFDALYLLLYLAMILVWPYPSEAARFLIVIIPVAMRLAVSAWDSLGRSARLGRIAMVSALLVVSVPQSVFNLKRLAMPVPTGMAAFKRFNGWYQPNIRVAAFHIAWDATFTRGLQSLSHFVPKGQCILSPKPSITAFYAHRMTYGPPPASVSRPAFLRQIEASHCHYVFMVAMESPTFPESMYPLKRLTRIFGHPLVLLDQASFYAGGQPQTIALLAELPPWPSRPPDAPRYRAP